MLKKYLGEPQTTEFDVFECVFENGETILSTPKLIGTATGSIWDAASQIVQLSPEEETKTVRCGDLMKTLPKSKRPAKEGLKTGKFKFFTSSDKPK